MNETTQETFASKKILVIFAMSGAGATTATKEFEFWGDRWMPVLYPDTIAQQAREYLNTTTKPNRSLGLFITTRNCPFCNDLDALTKWFVTSGKQGIQETVSEVKGSEVPLLVVFLTTSDNCLINRYINGAVITDHPLQELAGSLHAAVQLEATLFNQLKQEISFLKSGMGRDFKIVEVDTSLYNERRALWQSIAEILGRLQEDHMGRRDGYEGHYKPIIEAPEVPDDGIHSKLELMHERAQKAVEQNSPTVLFTGEDGVGKDIVARWMYYRIVDMMPGEEKVNRDEFLLSNFRFQFIDCKLLNRLEKEGYVFFEKLLDNLQDIGVVFLDNLEALETNPQLTEIVMKRLTSREWLSSLGQKRLFASVNIPQRYLPAAPLYNKLGQINIDLPSLRERRDIVTLALSTLRWLLPRFGKKELDEAAKGKLQRYDFPGNLKELEEVICTAARRAERDRGASIIEERHIEFAYLRDAEFPLSYSELKIWKKAKIDEIERQAEWMEQELIERALRKTDDNIAKAADLLGGISRQYLWKKLQDYKRR